MNTDANTIKERSFNPFKLNNFLPRIFFSFLICCVIYLCLSFFFHFTFFINDDENIMYTLSGYYTYGIPSDHPFINYILSFILRNLYSFFPKIQWYTAYHIFIIISSLTIFNNLIIKYLYGKLNNLIIILFSFITDLAVFSYVIILFQFTTTSTLAGCTVIALIYDLGVKISNNTNNYILNITFIILYSILCYMHRKNTFYVVSCFILLVFIYIICENFKKIRKCNKILIILFFTFILIFLSVILCEVISQKKRSSIFWQNYYEYDTARFHMTDYPHANYLEEPQLYEEIGWTPSLYTLSATSYWFFMDKRINKETFKKISSSNINDFKISKMYQNWSKLMKDTPLAFYETFLLIIFLLLNLIYSIKTHNFSSVFLTICNLLGSIILISYLCYIQRIPLRAYQT